MRLLLSLLIGAAFTAEVFAQGMATLRPGDVFEMRLGGMSAEFAQEFNTQYTIGQEGRVNFPHIGEVQAVGLTPNQLQNSIQNKLIADKIFTRPSVNINVVNTLRTVTVGGGGVRQANKIQWSPDLSLSSAIDQAGGYGDFADKKRVRLIRDGKVQSFDMRKVEKDPSLDPKLLPGDQVTVPGG
jgi:protein involved in polysaccharide export with SLBB domain